MRRPFKTSLSTVWKSAKCVTEVGCVCLSSSRLFCAEYDPVPSTYGRGCCTSSSKMMSSLSAHYVLYVQQLQAMVAESFNNLTSGHLRLRAYKAWVQCHRQC